MGVDVSFSVWGTSADITVRNGRHILFVWWHSCMYVRMYVRMYGESNTELKILIVCMCCAFCVWLALWHACCSRGVPGLAKHLKFPASRFWASWFALRYVTAVNCRTVSIGTKPRSSGYRGRRTQLAGRGVRLCPRSASLFFLLRTLHFFPCPTVRSDSLRSQTFLHHIHLTRSVWCLTRAAACLPQGRRHNK